MKKIITTILAISFILSIMPNIISNVKADEIIQEHLFSHMNTATVNYCYYDGTENWGNRYDLLVGTHPEYMEELHDINPNAINLFYLLFCTIITTDYNQYNQIEMWCTEHGVDVEEMFLHYAVNTSVTLSNGVTLTIPGWGTQPNEQSRVKTYIWTSYRDIFNVGSPYYQQYQADRINRKLDTPIPGTDDIFYKGVMVDECPVRAKWMSPNYGGDILELSGSYDDEREQYLNQGPGLVAFVKQQMGDRLLLLNTATYAQTDYAREQQNAADGALLELWANPTTHYFESSFDFIKEETVDLEKIMMIVHTGCSICGITRERDGMFVYGFYLMVHSNYTYFAWTPDGYGDLRNAWLEAYEYNIGQPQDQFYVYDQIQQTLVNISGGYQTFDVKIYGRQFDNALVLIKPSPHYNVQQTVENFDERSLSNHSLPVTQDNPSGIYYRLNSDGTIDPTPLTNIGLRLGEAVVLIKESSINPQPDTTPPDISILSPENGNTTTNETIAVSGVASDNVGVTCVTVNDIEASYNSNTNQWTAEIQLVEGENTIISRAYDAAGNFNDDVIMVILENEVLSISIEATGPYGVDIPQGETLFFKVTVDNPATNTYNYIAVISCFWFNEDIGEWINVREGQYNQFCGTPVNLHIYPESTLEFDLAIGVGSNVEPGRYKIRAYLIDNNIEIVGADLEGTVQPANPVKKYIRFANHLFKNQIDDILIKSSMTKNLFYRLVTSSRLYNTNIISKETVFSEKILILF